MVPRKGVRKPTEPVEQLHASPSRSVREKRKKKKSSKSLDQESEYNPCCCNTNAWGKRVNSMLSEVENTKNVNKKKKKRRRRRRRSRRSAFESDGCLSNPLEAMSTDESISKSRANAFTRCNTHTHTHRKKKKSLTSKPHLYILRSSKTAVEVCVYTSTTRTLPKK